MKKRCQFRLIREARHAAEAADVAVAQLLSGGVEVKDQMQMVRSRSAGVHDGELAGHAEVDDEKRAIVQVNDDPFSTPTEDFDAPVGQQVVPGTKPGPAQLVLAGTLHGDEAPAHEQRSQVADDGLDFRQLGHGVSLVRGGGLVGAIIRQEGGNTPEQGEGSEEGARFPPLTDLPAPSSLIMDFPRCLRGV